jgi:uncharacterized membrane protein YphA (DoxX/SURF4 family)
MKNKLQLYWYRGLLTILTVLFVLAGMGKVLCRPDQVELFSSLGIPKTIMITIGFTEIVLGILLQIRYFVKLSIHALITLMVVATLLVGVAHGLTQMVFPSLMIGVLVYSNYLGQQIKNKE